MHKGDEKDLGGGDLHLLVEELQGAGLVAGDALRSVERDVHDPVERLHSEPAPGRAGFVGGQSRGPGCSRHDPPRRRHP